MRKITISFIVMVFILLVPVQVLAVEYTITDVEINAYLQENGDVKVTEMHSYSFDSKFNGITREIFPKNGAEISGFVANEGEKTLKVEKEEHLYKVHRKGNKEKINITLQYNIKNGVEKYSDITEFYWPFFDERNESTYENLKISIHPPESTDEVIAFGYDEAFNKQKVENEGTVSFLFGGVEAGENGDIRVAYQSSLFSAMSTTSDMEMKETLVKEKRELEEKAEKFAENKENMSTIGKLVIPGIVIVLIGLFCVERIRMRRKQIFVNQEMTKQNKIVPEQKMSMPATILYTKSLTSESVVASLLDLYGKGFVNQLSDEKFELVNRNVEHQHEKLLMEWLFDEIGKNGIFRSNDLKNYINKVGNLTKYYTKLAEWKKAVKEEVNFHNLKESRILFRWLFASVSIILIPLFVLFLNYELYLLGSLSFGLIMIALGVALFYKPISIDGLLIKREWREFSARLNEISSSDWRKTTENTRMRALIYELGISEKDTMQYMEPWQKELGGVDHSILTYYLVTGPLLSSEFNQAEEKYKQLQTTNSSSSSSIGTGGGGVGGGGGGSGAF